MSVDSTAIGGVGGVERLANMYYMWWYSTAEKLVLPVGYELDSGRDRSADRAAQRCRLSNASLPFCAAAPPRRQPIPASEPSRVRRGIRGGLPWRPL